MKVQIDFWNGKKSLEYEAENLKQAVEMAVKDGANLRCANLYGANLRCANLGYANLGCANLGYANLYGANLRCANLYGANLYGANLGYANLRCANLRCANLGYANLRCANLGCANLGCANLGYANLEGANLENVAITLLVGIHQRYSVVMIDNDIKIGCERHSVEAWEKFTQKEIIVMDGKEAFKWWKEHKNIIIALAKLHLKKVSELKAPKSE
ncbi:MAG: pentapeptide repeat-containing protein [Victivallaceae bacterium]|nr:pentapeptide repeat-containing protein [Victivallaceae bacterium]